MTRHLLLLLLLAATPASAQDDLVKLDTQIASLQTQLDARDISGTTRDSLRSLLTRTRRLADDARRAADTDTTASTGRPESGAQRALPGARDSLVSTPSSSILSPFVLGIFVVLGAILVGVGLWVMWQRKQQAVSGIPLLRVRRPPLTGAEQQQRHAAQGGRPLYASHDAVEALERQVQALRHELDEARAWISEEHRSRQAAAAAPPAPAVMPQPSPAVSPADAAASAFTDWCRRATPMMSKVDFFSNALATSVPGARIQTVYRDLNSQAEPIRFDTRGGASPAEFWLVSVGSDALLFPQPLTGTQFRDLTRVFEGAATPQTLGQIAPARVRDEGGSFVLVHPGRIS